MSDQSPVRSLRFEYKLLVSLAVLQQSMGLGGFGHGELALATESKGSTGKKRHGLIHCFGCTVRWGHRERNAQSSCVLIGEGHHPCGTPGEDDGIGELALAGSVQHSVHRWADLANPIG